MTHKYRLISYCLIIVLMLILTTLPALAQDDDSLPRAEIANDEGGPVLIEGESFYTFPNFDLFFSEPFVAMRDVAGLVERDVDFLDEEISQVFGKILDDAFAPPFTYQLSLPIRPLGEYRNFLDPEDMTTGVMIFSISIAQNMLGDPFQEERDFISGLLNSVVISTEIEDYLDVKGGKLLLWTPDDQHAFPAGYGEDGRLFTEDDPLVLLPAGYTVVDVNEDPFIFDRSERAFVELREPEEVEANDFSMLTYTEAFDEMIELYRREYAFTEYKTIDWDALKEEFRPRVEEAESTRNVNEFRRTIRDFAWSIPDGHIFAPIDNLDFSAAIEGGLGIAIRELHDGRVIVHFLTPDGPAEQAGIELRAEILEIDGQPILDAIEQSIAWSAPFSTPDFERLQQLRYVTRYPMTRGEIEVVYQNPDDDEPSTVLLPLVQEQESFGFSSFNVGLTGTELPIEFEILDNGYGFIKIYSFSDDLPLTFRLWERALRTMRNNGVPGIIIDMRQNDGGSAYMADQLPAYFFDERLILGYSAVYRESIDDFYYDPDLPAEFVPPAEEYRYYGDVVVLISPACQSACESFSYNMTIQDRAAIVGHYPTSGLGGSVVPIFLPDGVVTTITEGRSLDADGEIHIEGVGVVPTIHVPVTEEVLFSDGDALLEAAIEYLDDVSSYETIDGGEIALGDSVAGELVAGSRVEYAFVLAEDANLDFIIDSELETILRIYIAANGSLAIEEIGDVRGIDVPGGLDLILEIGSMDDVEDGSFIFTVRESEPATFDIQDNGTVAVGESVEGELAPNIRVLYTLEVESDGLIDIAVTDESGALDTYLRVYVDDDTEPAYENDDIELGIQVNSMLTGIEVTEGQMLTIEIAGYNESEEGTFTLAVTESE